MDKGEALEVGEIIGGWARVRTARGEEGWSAVAYLTRPFVYGVDLSFSWVLSSSTWIREARARWAPLRVVVQNIWTGFIIPKAAYRNMVQLSRAGEDLLFAVYVVMNPSLDPSHVYDLASMFRSFPLRAVFLDVEPTPNNPAWRALPGKPAELRFPTEKIRAWAEALRDAFRLPTGIYTARWVWERFGCPDWSSLREFPLWLAKYDGRAELPLVADFGPPGWRPVGKQYRGTTRLAGIDVDLNVFDLAFFGASDEPGAGT